MCAQLLFTQTSRQNESHCASVQKHAHLHTIAEGFGCLLYAAAVQVAAGKELRMMRGHISTPKRSTAL